MEYQISDGNLQRPNLYKVYNSEGYSSNIIDGSCAFYYYRKDHLGNIREVWRADYLRAGTTHIAATTNQMTQYYPSGLPWSEGMGASSQSRKFNGKEFVEMHGLDTYDYGARGYYPAMGRFMTVDPLAEKYYSISPYAYCGGDPVNRIDPDGEDYTITIQRDKNNEITGITFNATVYITGDGASTKRAEELNGLAKETFKSQESNGVTIGFNVNYKYDKKISSEGDLQVGKGLNLLTFNKDNGRSNVDMDRDLTHSGYNGYIFNSKDGSSNYDVMHETGHFLGFSDRYFDYKDKNGDTQSKAFTGYKKDLMGTNGKLDLSPNHYANMYEFVLKQPAVQQHKFLKQINGGDNRVDQWFKNGDPNKGTLK